MTAASFAAACARGVAVLVACGLAIGTLAPRVAGAALLAGSGAAGLALGSASQAQMMLPAAVAADARGNVYVADAAAQRIDVVRADGSVEDLAGGNLAAPSGLFAFGGFQDGPATQAHFRHPGGVAVGPDGAVYVADTFNHCIRKIASGTVSTFAGAWNGTDGVDGPVSSARMRYPKGIAFDAAGNLYVADFFTGVRRVTPSGQVETLKLPVVGNRPTNVSTFTKGTTTYLFVTDDDHALVKNLSTGAIQVWSDEAPATTDPAVHYIPLEGFERPGRFASLVALGPAAFAYTDAANNAVKIVNGAVMEPLTAELGTSLAGPLGIARAGDRLVVADSGHRRLLTLPVPDLRYYATSLLPEKPRGAYRITVVGNSFTFWDTLWDDSVPGLIERRLRQDAAKSGAPRIEVAAVRLGPFGGIRDYIENALSDGETDAVVLQMNTAFIYASWSQIPWDSNIAPHADVWREPIASGMRGIAAALAKQHVPLLVVVHPQATESGPIEQLDAREAQNGGVSDEDVAASYPAFTGVLASLHLPHIADLGPAFAENEQSAGRQMLFGSRDFHFTPAGRAFVADRIADEIERVRPWSEK